MCWHHPKHLHVLTQTSQQPHEAGNFIIPIFFMKNRFKGDTELIHTRSQWLKPEFEPSLPDSKSLTHNHSALRLLWRPSWHDTPAILLPRLSTSALLYPFGPPLLVLLFFFWPLMPGSQPSNISSSHGLSILPQLLGV